MKINFLCEWENEIENSLNEYEKNLIRDLKLEILFEAMSEGDAYLYDICEKILVRPLCDEEKILTRQGVIKDVIKYPYFFKTFYDLTKAAIEDTKAYRKFTEPKYYQIVPESKKIRTEIEITEILIKTLDEMMRVLNEADLNGTSQPLKEFKESMRQNFNRNYFEQLQSYIKEVKGMKEGGKIIISDRLKLGLSNQEGILNEIASEEILLEEGNKTSLLKRLFNKEEKNNLTQDIILIDNTILANNKQELVEASLNSIFRLISGFNKNLLSLFERMRFEFGFFGGCSRLYMKLKGEGIALCMPTLLSDKNIFQVTELTDLALALKNKDRPVANNMSMENKKLWIITGANQGGKTTFLRSFGISVLMAQCGLFVGAKSYCGTIYKGIYTHFPDQEDGTLSSGLLDQELNKLDQIIKVLRPGSLFLMNESFATTTEREGSYIAEEVTMGLKAGQVTTVFVTHLYEYAHKFYEKNFSDTIFYCAPRDEKGKRSYQLKEGEPLKSSYGMDLYEIIGE